MLDLIPVVKFVLTPTDRLGEDEVDGSSHPGKLPLHMVAPKTMSSCTPKLHDLWTFGSNRIQVVGDKRGNLRDIDIAMRVNGNSVRLV
jgi:hypothetical protein